MRPDSSVVSYSPPAAVPVDGHVHFHNLGRVGPTLDAAAGNFARLGLPQSRFLGVLMLVQSARERIFEALEEINSIGDWSFGRVAGEPQSLLAASGSRRILIVRGQQIRCAKGLEVLAFGNLHDHPHGCKLARAVDNVRSAGQVAVVPWGFLKWRGSRGRSVRMLMGCERQESLFFGDNGGRMSALGLPHLLHEAASKGYRLLPGSDPFPFGRDYTRVGAFGFLAGLELDTCAPWTSLQDWLQKQANQPSGYGHGLGPLKFAFNQAWIQVHNRIPARSRA